MDELLKLLAQSTAIIEKLNALLLMHDIEINELKNQVKELQHDHRES